MQRRKFLRTAGLGAAGVASVSTLATPAIAESMPELKWRLASSFPKSLDTLYGTGEIFARYISEMTDNRFNVRIFAAGEIVPGLQVLDAVQNGTVEMGHSAGTYYVGKDTAFAFDTALPFGNNSRQQEAWMRWGGGRELLNELYKEYNIYSLGCGLTGAQMGGWFRKEINKPEDFQGLKFRMGGFAGAIMQKLGVIPQSQPAGQIYEALEKGTIDAAEFVGPYDDEKLGFVKVAPYYYYPGWWEGSAALHGMFNKAKFDGLPPAYQAILKTACQAVNEDMQAHYDFVNATAIKAVVAEGAKLQPFSPEILAACWKATEDTYTEMTAKSPTFGKMLESLKGFRRDYYLWNQVGEYPFDAFMMQQQRANAL